MKKIVSKKIYHSLKMICGVLLFILVFDLLSINTFAKVNVLPDEEPILISNLKVKTIPGIYMEGDKFECSFKLDNIVLPNGIYLNFSGMYLCDVGSNKNEMVDSDYLGCELYYDKDTGIYKKPEWITLTPMLKNINVQLDIEQNVYTVTGEFYNSSCNGGIYYVYKFNGITCFDINWSRKNTANVSGEYKYVINDNCKNGVHTITSSSVYIVDIEATCSQNGSRSKHCIICGEIVPDTEEIISATGEHKWDVGAVTKKATCIEDGIMTYTCTICGDTKTEDIPKSNSHIWDTGHITKEPTTTSEGEKIYTCTVCKTVRVEKISKLTGSSGVNNNNNNNSNGNNNSNNNVTKKPQKIKATTSKKVSEKKLKKKAQSFKLSAKSTSGNKIKYKLIKKNKNIKFAASSGKVTVKKGTKKGIYKIKVKMTVSGNDKYNAYASTKTIKIIVR